MDQAIRDTAQNWFLRISEGKLTERDLFDFKAWRDADQRHHKAYEEIRCLWNEVDELKFAFAPTDRELIHSRKHPPLAGKSDSPERLDVRNPGFRHRSRVWSGLIAACLALFILYTSDFASILRADFRTSVGEQKKVTLPDGSIALLNTETAISTNFANNRRQITLLGGEALFEVAKDPARPFSVKAGDGVATAIGTAFTVSDLDETVFVRVIEGTVKVSGPDHNDTGSLEKSRHAVTLTAGQQVRYGAGELPGGVTPAIADSDIAWTKGFIVIKGEPMDQAISKIDRYRPGKIFIAADASELQPITARLSIEMLDVGLEALVSTHGLTVTRLTDYVLIIH
ncbi:MAG: FecR family protein [Candidatus Nitronauta litoralis]|uniref:FecR family protein n=1 Tax=Candidatus Nitronauta litoralis TaxID=2705533 RepID=A0A7T0BWD1_9BACT|nr:MAG: FecR family protein [Candidatus Nitronauta litoralis]